MTSSKTEVRKCRSHSNVLLFSHKDLNDMEMYTIIPIIADDIDVARDDFFDTGTFYFSVWNNGSTPCQKSLTFN